jgi:hypothetical protein
MAALKRVCNGFQPAAEYLFCGDGADASGKGPFLVKPDTRDVKVFGLTEKTAGLACTILPAKPVLDLTLPVKA